MPSKLNKLRKNAQPKKTGNIESDWKAIEE